MECGVEGHFVPIVSTFTEVKRVKFNLPSQIDTVGAAIGSPIIIHSLPLTKKLTLRNTSLYLLKYKDATLTPHFTLHTPRYQINIVYAIFI